MKWLFATTLILSSLLATPASAQFGQAGAVELSGTLIPGVDMPLFGVYNRVYQNTDAPSTISLATTRSSIVQIFMENVAPSSSTGLPNTEIGGSLMLPANFSSDPWPTQYPTTSPGAPAYTNTRFNRVYVREVYNDMALVWNYSPFVSTTPFTSYDLLISVSWPAGVGQAFGNVYPAGSAILKVRYDVIP